MIIYKVELENITTHKNTVIEFEKGLNLLYGPNGTGKSTILNMIGYVLFNFLPSNQKNYVRSVKEGKKKFGIVKIWIAQNDDLFVIQKTLSKTKPLIEVLDARTEVAIDASISNAVELQEWMKKQFGLRPEIDLAKIFSTSIGVPQGTFTAPFLRTPQKRKDFFNPILQLDVYRKVFKQMATISAAFKEDLNKAKIREGNLTGILQNKQKLLQQKKENTSKIIKAKNELHKVEKELLEKEKSFKKLRELNTEFILCESNLDKAHSNKRHLSSYNERLRETVKDAQEANTICKETESDFKRYKTLLEEKELIERKSETLNKIDEELNDLYKKTTVLESSGNEIKRLIDTIKEEKKNLSALERDFEEFHNLQDLIQVQRDKLTKINVYEEELENWKNQYSKIAYLIRDLEVQLKKFPDIEKRVTTESDLKPLFYELISNQGELKARSEQKLEIKKFKEKVNLRFNENAILSNLKAQSKKLESIEKDYIILKHRIDKDLPEFETKYKELIGEVQPILKKISPLEEKRKNLQNIPSKLTEVKEELKKIKPNHDSYQTYRKLTEQLPNIEKDLQKSNIALIEIDKEIEIWEKKKKDLEESFDNEEFKKGESDIKAFTENRGVLKNMVNGTETRLQEIEADLKLHDETEKELKLIQNEIESLEFMIEFTSTIRNFFNSAGPNITAILLKNINKEAKELYKDIMEDPSVDLIWDNEFLIRVETSENIKEFHQLSGGEQMAAALAVRLAILKVLSNADFAFFDEPTMNLDIEKRESLARLIQRIIPNFNQIFVISHDDCFEENVDNVIKFTKGENEETVVEYIGKSESIEFIWDD